MKIVSRSSYGLPNMEFCNIKAGIDVLRNGDRTLFYTSAIHLILALILLLICTLDQRIVNGELVWLKPIRFCISIGLFTGTYAWFAHFFQNRKWITTLFKLIAVFMFTEMILISMQAARGVPSHFNGSTAFDAGVFSIMGAVIGMNAIVLFILYIYFIIWEHKGGVYRKAIIWAMTVFLLGNLAGFLLIYFFPYSGDSFASKANLKMAHFIGLHGLQFLPIVAYLIQKTQTPPGYIHLAGVFVCFLWLAAILIY